MGRFARLLKKRRLRSRKSRANLKNLLLSLAAVPALGLAGNCYALTPPQESEVQFQYFFYKDWQAGDKDRMEINTPMAWVRTPLGQDDELKGSFVLDSMSGASPLYHDTLSGASQRGIEDSRRAADLNYTRNFDSFSLGLGGSVSNEDDYDSLGGNLEAAFWTPDQNTIFNVGLSLSADEISSTNDPTLDEEKDSWGAGFGVVQLLDKNSMLQSNFTYAGSDGYLNDPYKSFDLRPSSRDNWAWLNRYVLYFPEMDSSLHADYRIFRDSWGVIAHTYEVAWYQPLREVWMVSPRLRYYTQSRTDFYSRTFPPDDPGSSFFSADSRLGGFGAIGTGINLRRTLNDKTWVNFSCDYYQQRAGLKGGSEGSIGVPTLHAVALGIGFNVRF